MKSYHAFLLRCWCETSEAPDSAHQAVSWRYLVVEIGVSPQAPRGFADFEQLTRYLASQLSGDAPGHGETDHTSDTPLETFAGHEGGT